MCPACDHHHLHTADAHRHPSLGGIKKTTVKCTIYSRGACERRICSLTMFMMYICIARANTDRQCECGGVYCLSVRAHTKWVNVVRDSVWMWLIYIDSSFDLCQRVRIIIGLLFGDNTTRGPCAFCLDQLAKEARSHVMFRFSGSDTMWIA